MSIESKNWREIEKYVENWMKMEIFEFSYVISHISHKRVMKKVNGTKREKMNSEHILWIWWLLECSIFTIKLILLYFLVVKMTKWEGSYQREMTNGRKIRKAGKIVKNIIKETISSLFFLFSDFLFWWCFLLFFFNNFYGIYNNWIIFVIW